MKKDQYFYSPRKNTLTTKQLFYFLYDFKNNIDLFFFTASLASGADKASSLISKALIINAGEEEKEKYQNNIDNPGKNYEQLLKYSTTNSKNLHVNIVDCLFLVHFRIYTMRNAEKTGCFEIQ